MQTGFHGDSFNALNILAVAADLHPRRPCNTDNVIRQPSNTPSVDSSQIKRNHVERITITKVADSKDLKTIHISKNCIQIRSDVITKDIAGPFAGDNNTSVVSELKLASLSNITSVKEDTNKDMKLPSDLLHRHAKQDSDVCCMFEEHNYGTCRKNFDYIIEDEPFNGDEQTLNVNDPFSVNNNDKFIDILCDKSIGRRHDSGYSEPGAIIETIAPLDTSLDDSGLADTDVNIETIDSSNLEIMTINDPRDSVENITNPHKLLHHKSNNDDYTRISTNSDAIVSSSKDSVNDVFTTSALSTTQVVCASYTSASTPINNIDSSADISNKTKIVEPNAAVHQTIIKSLLTGRTIIVVPKSDNYCAQTTTNIRSQSVTSPASCGSSSSIILSPDSAYSTDSNMADETFFTHSPDIVPAPKREQIDTTRVNTPLTFKHYKSSVDMLDPSISKMIGTTELALKELEDTKENLSHLSLNNRNKINEPLRIQPKISMIKIAPESEQNFSDINCVFPIHSTPSKQTSQSELSSTSTSPRVGKFRIGSIASFSNNNVVEPSDSTFKIRPTFTKPISQTVIQVTEPLSVSPEVEDSCRSSASLFNTISVAPSDILDVHVPSTSLLDDNVALDHDYCSKFVAILPDTQPPKLGRPPTRILNRKRRPSIKKVHTRSSKDSKPTTPVPSDNEDDRNETDKLKETVDVILDSQVVVSPSRRLKRGDSFDEPEDQDSKVKITGNYQDEFVYYVCKTDRVTRRQRSKLPIPILGIIIPPPTAADIVVPRLSDADIVALKDGSPTPSGVKVPDHYLQADKPSSDSVKSPTEDVGHVINTILNMEVPSDENDMSFNNFSHPTDDLSELTTEQMNMLFSAIDEIQSNDIVEDVEQENDDVPGEIKSVETRDESNVSPTTKDEFESFNEPTEDTNDHADVDKTNSDNTPWIVIVTIYWNDLPAVMIDMHPYVRLIDIYKQILPAKDTGILKKRCQLLSLDVRNCTEMQRYFLVKYGHAHNSKSSLVISKEDASQLIAFYVEPQPKVVKPDRCRKNGSTAKLHHKVERERGVSYRQVVTPRGDGRLPRTPFTDVISNPIIAAPLVEPLGRLRHKKINFRGLLRGEVSSDDSDADSPKSPDRKDRKPRRNITKQSRKNTINDKSVIKNINRSSDGPRFSRRELRCRVNGSGNNILPLTNGGITPTRRTRRISLSQNDQNTQTAHFSDYLTSDSETSPMKRYSNAIQVSSPSKFHNLRRSPIKRKLDLSPEPVRYSTRSHGDESSPAKRKLTMVNENCNNSSSVITLSNGPEEYQTFTALDDEMSF